MLNALSEWCDTNYLSIDYSKINIVHFRSKPIPRSNTVFKCGDNVLEYTDCYTYLGLLLNEYLDLNVTAKMVAQSASRALGLLIAKVKLIGGVPHNVYKII